MSGNRPVTSIGARHISRKTIFAIVLIGIIIGGGITAYSIDANNSRTQNSNLLLISLMGLILTPMPVELNLLWSYETGYTIKAVSISPDGNYIAAVGENDTNDIVFFLNSSGHLLWSKNYNELFGFEMYIYNVSVSLNGSYIAISSMDKTGLVYKNGTASWNKDLGGQYHFASISDDGEYVAVGTYGDKRIYLLNSTAEGDTLWSYDTNHYVASVAITGDGEYIVAGDYNGTVYCRDKQNSTGWVKNIQYSEVLPGIITVSPSQQGDSIGVAYRGYGKFGLLNSSGDWMISWTDCGASINAFSLSPTGELLFLALRNNIKIYDTETRTYVGLYGFGQSANCIDITVNGDYLAAGSGTQIHLLQIIKY